MPGRCHSLQLPARRAAEESIAAVNRIQPAIASWFLSAFPPFPEDPAGCIPTEAAGWRVFPDGKGQTDPWQPQLLSHS